MSQIRKAGVMTDEELYALRRIFKRLIIVEGDGEVEEVACGEFRGWRNCYSWCVFRHDNQKTFWPVMNVFLADAALLMQLGCDGGEFLSDVILCSSEELFGSFRRSGIFHVGYSVRYTIVIKHIFCSRVIGQTGSSHRSAVCCLLVACLQVLDLDIFQVTHYQNPKLLAEISEDWFSDGWFDHVSCC